MEVQFIDKIYVLGLEYNIRGELYIIQHSHALRVYLDIVSDVSGFALERTRQRALRKLKLEREVVNSARQDRSGTFLPVYWNTFF